MDFLQEIMKLHKTDHVVVASRREEGDTKSRAIIQNKIARKALEKSIGKSTEENNNCINNNNNNKKACCLCSPTTHVGSFRCRLHRTTNSSQNKWPSKIIPQINQIQDPKGVGVGVGQTVRTLSEPRPISRFGRTACDKLPLAMPIMASSKPEQVN